MRYKIFVHEHASEDIETATLWYDEQLRGLGTSFLTELDKTLHFLSVNPYIFQVKRRNLRQAIFKRFPYLIIYEIENKSVIIYNVIHSRKHPRNRFAKLRSK